MLDPWGFPYKLVRKKLVARKKNTTLSDEHWVKEKCGRSGLSWMGCTAVRGKSYNKRPGERRETAPAR